MTDIPAAPADPGIAHPDRGEIARYLLSRVWTRRPGRWFRGGSRWTLVRGTSSSFRLVSARNGNLPTKQFPPERANHLGVGYYTAYGKWTPPRRHHHLGHPGQPQRRSLKRANYPPSGRAPCPSQAQVNRVSADDLVAVDILPVRIPTISPLTDRRLERQHSVKGPAARTSRCERRAPPPWSWSPRMTGP
jgi:hypothetical protein